MNQQTNTKDRTHQAICLSCQQVFKPFKKSSFCAKCLHQQLTERQGNLRRRHLTRTV